MSERVTYDVSLVFVLNLTSIFKDGNGNCQNHIDAAIRRHFFNPWNATSTAQEVLQYWPKCNAQRTNAHLGPLVFWWWCDSHHLFHTHVARGQLISEPKY